MLRLDPSLSQNYPGTELQAAWTGQSQAEMLTSAGSLPGSGQVQAGTVGVIRLSRRRVAAATSLTHSTESTGQSVQAGS